MKFNVSRNNLFQQLQTISHVIASKNTIKILERVLFELEGNTLTLKASDSETTIRTSIDVENAEGAGKVAFSTKMLIDTLKEFPEQALTFAIDDQTFSLNITSFNGSYSLVGENGNEYPEMPIIEDNNLAFTMSGKSLLRAIDKTLFATSDDEYRKVMNGLYIDLHEDKITFVATDAHRLVRFNDMSVHSDTPAHFILPKKPATILVQALAKESGDVLITLSEKNAKFEFGRTLILCRQIEGAYPNYNGVIPQQNNNIATIDKNDLLNACRRVAVFADNGTTLLKLDFKENQLHISAQDIEFSTSAEETLTCSYEQAPISIGFKGKLLNDLLNHIESDEVVIKLADSTRAGLILPTENEENEDVLMLLMPMMLND